MITTTVPEDAVSLRWMRCKDQKTQDKLEKIAKEKQDALIRAQEERAEAAKKLNAILSGPLSI